MNSYHSFKEQFIKFTIKHLNIITFDDLYHKWEQVLDWFFYFNKCNGCGIPSFEDFRRYL